MAGVVATLKLQFARTMSLAVSISDNIRKPAVRRVEERRGGNEGEREDWVRESSEGGGRELQEEVTGWQVSFLAPFLIYSLPPEHHPWINPILDLICKFLAMSLAWYLSRVV